MPKSDLIGKTVLKDYVVEEYLGSGGYGDVYKAGQTRGLGKNYAAVKRLMIPTEADFQERLSSMRNDREATDNYFRALYTDILGEIALMHQLAGRSSHIVAYFQNDIIEHQDPIRYEIFIAMEYLTALDKHIRENTLTIGDVLRVGVEIASALEVCHGKGILHRDIKEANIFVNDDGVFKLGDFGLAKLLAENSKAASNVGSMAYKAPEIINPFSKYDKTVDIYSLGIVLYKLLNHGRIPFMPHHPKPYSPGDENEALKQRFSGESLPWPQCASQEAALVVIKACAAKPENRYQTATELKVSLQLLQKQLERTELDRSADIPPRKEASISEASSMGLDDFGTAFEESYRHMGIFDSEANQTRGDESTPEDKDRILWAYAKKEGNLRSIRAYLEETNPIRAYADEAWLILDGILWVHAVDAGSVKSYEDYLASGAKTKAHEVAAKEWIARYLSDHCRTCGVQLPKSWDFCKACGTKREIHSNSKSQIASQNSKGKKTKKNDAGFKILKKVTLLVSLLGFVLVAAQYLHPKLLPGIVNEIAADYSEVPFIQDITKDEPENQPAINQNSMAQVTSQDSGSMTITPSKDVFSGNAIYDSKNSTISCTWENGDKYEGGWINNAKNGQGTYTSANGDQYVGEWKDDSRNGQGTLTGSNGNQYSGEWANDKKNGQGTRLWANGDQYVGQWENDNRSGQGTLTWANHDRYVGEWQNDNRNGQGTLTWANGSQYTGQWTDNKASGQGVHIGADGNRYEGEWKDDKANGYGTYTGSDGNQYVGEWKDDKANGQGAFTDSNGKFYDGVWDNGYLPYSGCYVGVK